MAGLYLDRFAPKREPLQQRLDRECREAAARCRVAHGRLLAYGVNMDLPEFKPSARSRKMGHPGVYQVMKERAEHHRACERLLLDVLAQVQRGGNPAGTYGSA